jgi:hypothetical protein
MPWRQRGTLSASSPASQDAGVIPEDFLAAEEFPRSHAEDPPQPEKLT